MSGGSLVLYFGICVLDIEWVIVFYVNVFDFKLVYIFELFLGFENFVEFDDFVVSYVFLQNGLILIELVYYVKFVVEGSGYCILFNKVGFLYFCMCVVDMDEVCECIEVNGGCVYFIMWMEMLQGSLMFCLDFDGIWIEFL